ncbi:MAG: hypothetical protein U0T83_07805 [Bacteriovoracaceae bacterium]
MQKLFFTLLLLFSLNILAKPFSDGGDDAGNGGFAFKQSKKLLEIATNELLSKITSSNFPLLVDFPDRRGLLLKVLTLTNINQQPEKEEYRNGILLMFNYSKNPPKIIIYKSYYLAFAGTADSEIDTKVVEVKKRLLHEASHLWGFNEAESEKFSIAFLTHEGDVMSTNPRHNVTVNPNFCICMDGFSEVEPIREQYACTNFCKERGKDSPTLYVNIDLDNSDLANPKIKNLRNWCTADLNDGQTNPGCTLEVYDGIDKFHLPVLTRSENNSLTADLSPLVYLKKYIVKLVSTTGVASNAIQLQRKREISVAYPPIEIGSISNYYCVNPNDATALTSPLFTVNFFHNNYNYPEIDPMGTNSYATCYDFLKYGPIDSPLFPRLGSDENAFLLYDEKSDYFSLADNQRYTITNIISNILYYRYGITEPIDLFKPIFYQNAPYLIYTKPKLGYILKKFELAGKEICPTAKEFYSGIPIFTILNQFTPDTEAIYYAKREKISYRHPPTGQTRDAPDDSLFIREGILKKIWFHFENGNFIVPDEYSSRKKRVMFFWPADLNEPYVQKSNQKIFTIQMHPAGSNFQEKGLTDNRLGCIPKID